MQILVGLMLPVYLLLCLFTASNSKGSKDPPPLPMTELNYPSEGTCDNVDLVNNPHATCSPCSRDKWFELILDQRANDYKETHCFNDFPLGTNLPAPCPRDLTKGKVDHPELDLTRTPRGFIISKLPFFRYNTKLPDNVQCLSNEECPPTCTNSTVGGSHIINQSLEENLDIGHVKPYYDYNDTSADPVTVGLQIVEWPGRQTTEQKVFLQHKLNKECDEGKYKSYKPYLCSITEKGKRNFKMLKFVRESSKMLHYPCNKEEGTTIVALGLLAVYEEEESDEHPHSKLFLSYSNQSIFNAPGQPLYVEETILNQMARSSDSEPRGVCRKASEEPTNCDFTKDLSDPLPVGASDCDWRQKYFQDRGDIIMDKKKCSPFLNKTDCSKCKVSKAITGDLQTVLDFTFVQGRLLLGMRCGVLIVKGFLYKQLDIRPATLFSPEEHNKHAFPPINKISSSFCCKTTGCRKTIVAAYSSYHNRPFGVPKELYISYDLGDTFQVKLLIEPNSALNLIWGMYKLYGDWLLYFQLLETPDPEDLRDERGGELHPGYSDLRSVPDWDSLTLEKKERRLLFGETASKSHIQDIAIRKRALRRYVRLRTAGALGRFVRYRRLSQEINLDLSPRWLQEEISTLRKNAPVTWKGEAWTDANCDSVPTCRNNFVNDQAVEYFLKEAGIIVKTPKKAVEEYFCDQITSISVLQEEDSLYVICRVGFGDFSVPYTKSSSKNPLSCSSREDKGERERKPVCTYPLPTTVKRSKHTQSPKSYLYNECVNPKSFYAIYSISVKEKLPFAIIDDARSERLFTCKNMETFLDWYGCKKIDVRPELLRVALSITLLVKNCEEVLYYSPNGGRTLFNTQFYAVEDQYAGASNSSGCTQFDHCRQTSTNSKKRQLMYRLNALDVPPLISISPTNNVVFMTMKNMYAYGLLGINSEFRMVVGEIFPETETNIISKIRSNDFVFPDFTDGGLPFFAVALKLVYSHNKVISCKLYANRHGIRLVHMDFFFYKDISYFYEGNKDFDSEAKAVGLSARACHTYQFEAKPATLVLDVDETDVVEVSVYDPQPNIALGLVSSEEKSLIADVSLVDRTRKDKDKEHIAHNWDVHVRAIRNYKPRKSALVDSFFGAENNNMYGFYTEVGLANTVEFRCHVQPAATVSVHINCREKKMVVHEEEYRPQCLTGTFSKSAFEYRLKKGEFDPNLAGYWLDLDESEGKNLIKLDRATGDLVIVYDYLRFGCPLEPYKDEKFVPDLRIASADTQYNSSLGALYNGSFLLIELFGAKGFSFSRTYADYGCKYVPMNITNATLDWVHRQRLFRVAYGRQKSVSSMRPIEEAVTAQDLDALEIGNQLFEPDAVDHPINIINRVSYRDCKKWRSFYLESENKTARLLSGLSEEERELHLKQPLQIMWRDNEDKDHTYVNQVTWSKKSQQVYIFMAIALDPTESLCEYYTIFGVHLPELSDVNSLVTFLVFLFLVLLWLLLFACGYMCRKSRIRTLCIELERKRRLEEAAWKVVYQYERLLQENEHTKFEEEFQGVSETVDLEEQIELDASKNKQRPKCKHKPKCHPLPKCKPEPKRKAKQKCKRN